MGAAGGSGGDGGASGKAAGGGIYSAAPYDYDGQGVEPLAGSLTVEKSTISGNITKAGKAGKGGKAGSGGSGGDGRAEAGAPGSDGEVLDANGGGIGSLRSALTLTEVIIERNVAAASGGGVSVFENTSTVITDSNIRLNIAKLMGGGLHSVLNVDDDPVELISTVIAQNQAPTDPNIRGPVVIT